MITEKPNFLPMFHSTLKHFPTGGNLDAIEAIAKQNIPIYLLWGELDRTVPFAYHTMVLQRAPGVKLVKIEDVGHAVLFEDSNAVCKYVLEFVQE
jgi:pimeloyl-ACP methyl ester carboxylesterase